MNQTNQSKETTSIHHVDPLAVRTISDSLITSLPQHIGSITIVCIGTDRSTGDALGPMVGTLLMKMKLKLSSVQGTLSNPVHALNLDNILSDINSKQERPFLIAIDASLGKQQSVGHIHTGTGSILPGAALKKQLPAVGDTFITGIVNIAGFMEYSVLQSTRLSIVYDMAHTIAKILFHVDLWLQEYYLNRLKKSIPLLRIQGTRK